MRPAAARRDVTPRRHPAIFRQPETGSAECRKRCVVNDPLGSAIIIPFIRLRELLRDHYAGIVSRCLVYESSVA